MACRLPLAVVASAFCLLICGCGGGAADSISGTVTQNSQPVPFAEIAFTSQAENKQTYFGMGSDNGTYQLDLTGIDGVPPGSYDVSVTVWMLKDGSPLPAGEEGNALKIDGSAVQETRTFVKQVTSGANQIDLDLDEGQPVAAQP